MSAALPAAREADVRQRVALTNWSALRYFSFYRIVISGLFGLLASTSKMPPNVGGNEARGFTIVAVSYAIAAIVALVVSEQRMVDYRLQVYSLSLLDIVAIIALIVALLAAILMTWTLTRPLSELEEAARRVASGDLESQLTVRPGRSEVGRTMRAFNDMTRELASTRKKLLRAERIAAWREVARRIAHEIKNPLQPIQMEIERETPKLDDEGKPVEGETVTERKTETLNSRTPIWTKPKDEITDEEHAGINDPPVSEFRQRVHRVEALDKGALVDRRKEP